MSNSKRLVRLPASKHPAAETPQVKYPKPKMLLLDVADPVSDHLIARGFNVNIGSLGAPYRIEMGAGFQPVMGTSKLPNFTEQEIIVIDLSIGRLAPGPNAQKHRPDGEQDLWAKCDKGFIDPRPRAAFEVRSSFDRILNDGCAFIVFADKRTGIELTMARLIGGQFDRHLANERPFPYDVWNFISDLDDITVDDDHGMEMRAVDNGALGRLLAGHLDGGSFRCTVEGGFHSEDPWVTLAENKFGE